MEGGIEEPFDMWGVIVKKFTFTASYHLMP